MPDSARITELEAKAESLRNSMIDYQEKSPEWMRLDAQARSHEAAAKALREEGK